MMLKGIVNRLRVLEDRTGNPNPIVFTLEGGGSFAPGTDPITYLIENGRQAPDGRTITGARWIRADTDPLTRSIVETIDAAAAGRITWPFDLEGVGE